MENNTIPYFVIYSGEFKVFRGKLTEEEILRVFDKLSDISVLGMSDIEFTNEFQNLYFDKLFAQYLKNLKSYKAKVDNGKKGGRPKKVVEPPPVTETPKPVVYDITCNPKIDKVFDIYKRVCTNLKPIRYERRNRETLEIVAKFLEETQDDFEYFQEVCEKANKQKFICDNALDFRSVVKNHISISNEKFKKGNGNIGTQLKFK